jgi:hypothetical protein
MDRLLQRIGILIAILACSVSLGFGQIYVDADAAGANNGGSWADAYTSLQDALGVAIDGDEIWVADGTYSPGADTLSYFQLVEGVQVYGGFAGTEENREDRDPSANATILSGDVNGDDTPNDFENNREDNNFHVVFADSTITNSTILDGFTISGGTARIINSLMNPMRTAGGGILAEGSPIIANCTIIDNAAGIGGGFFPSGSDASRIKVLDCEIIRNFALFGGGIFSENVGGGLYMNTDISENTSQNAGGGQYKFFSRDTFMNCTINENQIVDTSSGAGVNSQASASVYVGCEFSGNAATFNGGAFNCTDTFQQSIIMVDCEFLDNSAPNIGGAITFRRGAYALQNCYFSGNISPFGGAVITLVSDIQIDSCTFEENQALSSGGGVYKLGANATVTNCTFSQNEAASDAGGMVHDGGTGTISNCTFDANTANNGAGFRKFNGSVNMDNCVFSNNEASNFGGGFLSDTLETNVTNTTFSLNTAVWGGGFGSTGGDNSLDNCLFEDNSIQNGGAGGMSVFEGSITITNSQVVENEGGYFGGGWYIQDEINASIENTRFTLNNLRDDGGNGMGVMINGPAQVVVDSCVFESNGPTDAQAMTGGGGGVACSGDSLAPATLEILKSTFIGNFAGLQGGAVELSATQAFIQNSVFYFNSATTGGAIINNGSFASGSTLELVNNTFVLNEADLGTDLAQWESPDNAGALASATLQNNIMVNGSGGDVYAVEDGTPELTSNGGNLVRDMSLGGAAVAEDVQGEDDAGFADVGSLDLSLVAGANAQDIGVNQGAPSDDITGMTRLAGYNVIVDAGAYERDTVTSVNNYVADFSIDMSPTLTDDIVRLSFDAQEMGHVEVIMVDYNGKVVFRSAEEKAAPTFNRTYSVGHLPSGTYFVRVITADKIGGGKFVVAQ